MAAITISKLSSLESNHRLDAKFYQPEYSIDFTKGKWQPIGTFLDTCQYGLSRAMTTEPGDCPILRMDDIRDSFLTDDEIKHVDLTEQELEKFVLKKNDVLFDRVNTEEFVGRTGIFKLKGEYVFASYLIRLRVASDSGILPDYLNVYLNSEFGRKQIDRFSRRAVNQANVNAEELKSFRICPIPMRIQNQISRISDEAWIRIELSKRYYSQAESMLLEKLGLGDFQPRPDLSYEASLSETMRAHRIDAEYFHPNFDAFLECITDKDHCRISEVLTYNRRGVQPRYLEEGEVKVVTSKRLGRIAIDYDNLERTTLEEWNTNARAQIGQLDILTYTTGAYVGRTNCFMEDLRAIASNHVNILRVREMNPIYVAVFLNSELGQTQVRRLVTGSAQFELYPSDMSKIILWKAPEGLQERIADLIRSSHEALRDAKTLLTEAKERVERAIRNEARKESGV